MIILIGPSASGKTSIAKELIEKHHFKKFITNTTRPMRIKEVNDVDYHFISKEEFEKKKRDNKLIEYTLYNGNLYGTSIEDVSDDKVLIVDINGANKFYEKLKEEIMIFYITCNQKNIKERMILRGDNEESIKARLALDKDYFDINKLHHYDYIISTDNDSIEKLADDIVLKYNKNKR